MNRYVIGYLSLHEGSLKLLTTHAISEVEACNHYLITNYKTMDEIHEYCANSDAYIEVMQL